VGPVLVPAKAEPDDHLPRIPKAGDHQGSTSSWTTRQIADEYAPLASFVGEIVRIDFDLKPDFVYDRDAHHDAQIRAAMIRQ